MNNSLWIDSYNDKDNYKKRDKLKENLETEVCIIGGGLTGITTAYYLTKANKKVIVLEKNTVGSHTSGNTTGKITSQHNLFYNYLKESYSLEYAEEYYGANEHAIKNIGDIIKEEKINCDFETVDSFVFTQDEKQVKEIEKEMSTLKKINNDAEIVNLKEIKLNKIKPILTAIKLPNQAQFNSYKYIQQLANIVEDNGGKIYENTKALDIKKDGNYYLIRTKENTIKTKYVVIASHYPIINFPGFYFLKMYQESSYLIAVETNEELLEGMYISAEKPTISYRTAIYNGKRIAIFGGAEHKTGKGKNIEYNYNVLEKIAKKVYSDCKVLYRWNAEDCISLDKIPYIGEFSDLMPNVYVGTGYKKWGITTSNIAAEIISDKVLGKKSKFENIFDSKRLKPIKNKEELGNMIKEVGESLIIKRIKKTDKELNDINEKEGKIIELNGEKVGAYKNEKGEIFLISPYCSHLGCELTWNNLDKTWDCPCHGSRFNYNGKNLYDPAIKDLEFRKL